MKTIHQFGDSYSSTLYAYDDSYITKNFIELISIELNYQYVNNAVGGISNEIILDILLNSINNIKQGDIVFINFSFFTRGCWYDDDIKKIKSTNTLYNDIMSIKKYHLAKNKHIIDLVEYYLTETKDYNMRIFKLFNSILNYIHSKGVNIFYIFVEENEWSDELLNLGTNIKFPNGFAKWLQKNNLHFEEEGHYTKGIQPVLANAILNKTNHFLCQNKSITIDMGDMDFNIKLNKKMKKNLL